MEISDRLLIPFVFLAYNQENYIKLNGWYREDVLDAGIPLTKELINKFEHNPEELEADLSVCIIPSPIQVYSRAYGQILERTFPSNPQLQRFLQNITRPQSIITKICQDLKIPFMDLYPIFYENNDQELFIPAKVISMRPGMLRCREFS